MKILQIIDTLNAGGAERVAVNYANVLSDRFGVSFLTTTRTSGVLQNELNDAVHYNNLNRSNTFDVKAIKVFKAYLKENEVDIVHAHTTSYFFVVLTKLIYPKLKIIWHDHQGNRDEISAFKQLPLIFSSLFFNGIICVNNKIKLWANKYLFCKNTIYIENFVASKDTVSKTTSLFGSEGKRIVNVANLKPPKNHQQLVKAFSEVHKIHSDWSLHLVGKDYEDHYSNQIKTFIEEHGLQNAVFIYGLRQDISSILKQCNIGVIASTFEGLPMALLEYGSASLAVITTDVGNCKELIQGRGIVVNKNSEIELTKAMTQLIENEKERASYSNKLSNYVASNFSEKAISDKIITFYRSLIN